MPTGTIYVTRIQTPPATSTPPEKLLSFRKVDSTAFLGEAATLTSGAPTTQWNATLRRYTRQALVASSAITERIQTFIEPRALVDPRYPRSGLVVKARNTLQLLVTGGPPPWSGSCYGRASFGFRANAGALSSANANQTPFVGFRLDLLPGSNVADPTWKADYVNWNSTTRDSLDTGLTSGTPRNLVIELNGDDQRIRWYIDGLLVRTFAPTANDVGGQNATPAEWSLCTETSVSAGGVPTPTFNLSWHIGVGQLLTCTYHDA